MFMEGQTVVQGNAEKFKRVGGWNIQAGSCGFKVVCNMHQQPVDSNHTHAKLLGVFLGSSSRIV